ncbi:MAG: class II aldolase/adducin family protein, partial [Dehalococcoidia bacterium]
RIPDTDLFLMPSQKAPGMVAFSDILTINLAGEKVAGQGVPNAETCMHRLIYVARPDVMSVCHTHSPMVILLSAVGQSVRPLTIIHGLYFSDGVPLFTETEIIVTDSLAQRVVDLLGPHRAIMLRGHGATIVGPEVRRTCIAAIDLEESAKMQVMATMLGKPQFFTEEEIAAGSASTPKGPDWTDEILPQVRRIWDYYVSRLPAQV